MSNATKITALCSIAVDQDNRTLFDRSNGGLFLRQLRFQRIVPPWDAPRAADPKPERPQTTREKIEGCSSPWDGNHNGFERQIQSRLNDPSSMETHETRFGTSDPDGDGRVAISMNYSARNAFGGRVRSLAWGELNYNDCSVQVTSY